MNNIKIAYLLLAHKDPEQINLFIGQLLDYGDCDIYIHIDKKSANIIDKINKHPNVFVYSIYDVRWGSSEIVKAGIYLMQKSLFSCNNYTHAYFGSAQDLLVKKGLYEFLSDNSKNIFIKIFGEVKNNSRDAARYKIKWPKKLMIRNDWHIYRFTRSFLQLLCGLGIVLFPNRKKLNNPVRFFEGRTWFITPICVVNYIVKYIELHPDFVDFWEDSLAPDLMFFQTLIMNSPYAEYVRGELMYVNFGNTFGSKNHPIDITIQDDIIINEKNFYCARKFEYKDLDTINYYLNKCANKKEK